MCFTIIDCYTDEPAGLGVPPYLGVYPRYIAGALEGDVCYLTIDDLRLFRYYNLELRKTKESQKTNIKINNLTKNCKNVKRILEKTKTLIVILGVHTPGKYLSAVPGTLREVSSLIKDLRCRKILTGPAVYGTQLEGGRFFEKIKEECFDETRDFSFSYDDISHYAVRGASIINQIPDIRIAEIETARGCQRLKGCSFCTEPIKSSTLEFRKGKDVLAEIKKLYELGVRYFRLGKQSCFYSYLDAEGLLKAIRKSCPDIKVLHIDNVNPVNVLGNRGIKLTKAIVKYCTPGNVAAFGVESFDMKVIRENNLNCTPEQVYDAVKILNRYGSATGLNGMPIFLPGINILFGLKGESKNTHEENMLWLKKILDDKLLLRRINIRQVSLFPGTPLFEEVKNMFLRKNKRYYWSWRKETRERIDYPMLRRLVPEGTVLRNVRTEIYDGKTTFARQLGTYPLIVGVKQRLPLNKFYDVRVKGHMLRSITAELL
jgi:radical SAM superfamily enzyme with C-terminal helix-hairpin-helix motif